MGCQTALSRPSSLPQSLLLPLDDCHKLDPIPAISTFFITDEDQSLFFLPLFSTAAMQEDGTKWERNLPVSFLSLSPSFFRFPTIMSSFNIVLKGKEVFFRSLSPVSRGSFSRRLAITDLIPLSSLSLLFFYSSPASYVLCCREESCARCSSQSLRSSKQCMKIKLHIEILLSCPLSLSLCSSCKTKELGLVCPHRICLDRFRKVNRHKREMKKGHLVCNDIDAYNAKLKWNAKSLFRRGQFLLEFLSQSDVFVQRRWVLQSSSIDRRYWRSIDDCRFEKGKNEVFD